MQIKFVGANREVTGSCHLIEVNGKTVMLDCGLFQGRRKEAFERNRRFEGLDPKAIHSVVLSHAHIDHSGNLPRLVAEGFRGTIHATSATEDLCGWMLRDSARIQERDIEHVNKKRQKKGQSRFEPLYTMDDAEHALERFEGIPYDHAVTVAPGVRMKFRDAGHILGSASVHLDIEEGDRTRRLVFTGDIGRKRRPILRDPVRPERADLLISESTYGNRLHAPEENVRKTLGEVLRRTFDRGGKLLIPAFSLGRTQHLVYHLHNLCLDGVLPPVPIFVDSPLAANVTEVYRAHPECYDAETMTFLEDSRDPFGFGRLTYVRDRDESIALNDRRDPCVIISASGMCEAGRVLHHLKRIAPDPRSTILAVGFMAEHTLGRRIVEKAPFIRVYGDDVPLEAEVASISGLSGHADRDEMLEYFGALDAKPERTFLVHGEETPALAFAETLTERGFPRVEVPKRGDTIRL